MKLNLKAIRQSRGLTIDQLAEMCGLSKGFVSQLENGRREPSSETLQTISATLRVPLTDLIDAGAEAPAFLRAMELIRALPADDQDSMVRIAEALLQKHAAR